MNHDIVRRIQSLALELVCNDRHGPIRLVTNDAPAAVFAGKFAAFEVECVAIAVARWISKHRDVSIVLYPPHLNVVGNVAPNQVSADTIPGRAFRPQRSEMQATDDGIADDVSPESIIQRNHVRIRVLNRIRSRPIALCRRRDVRLLRQRLRRRRCHRCSANSRRKKCTPIVKSMGGHIFSFQNFPSIPYSLSLSKTFDSTAARPQAS